MSANRSFVDTNLVVYAHDRGAGQKREQARQLIEELWQSGTGCVSVQVLQEFFVTVTRKTQPAVSHAEAVAAIRDFANWHVHAPTSHDVLAAAEVHRSSRISFWDAMIVRSAAALGCETLYTEDLNDNQQYEGVTVRNPLK